MSRLGKAFALVAIAWLMSACQKDIPRSQMPHFGTFCIHRTNWDKLVVVMRGFGCKNGLELHGGIDTSKPRGRYSMHISHGVTAIGGAMT